MHPFSYPARVEEVEPGEFLVTFADVPEALTSEPTREAAIEAAADALAVAIEGYLEAGRELPARRAAAADEIEIPLDLAVAARALLLQEMKRQGLSKVGLAQRLGRDEKAARRILSGKGATLDLTLLALRAVGVRPGLAV